LLHAGSILLPVFPCCSYCLVNPNKITGFSNSERLANTLSVTKLHYSSLQHRISLNSAPLVC